MGTRLSPSPPRLMTPLLALLELALRALALLPVRLRPARAAVKPAASELALLLLALLLALPGAGREPPASTVAMAGSSAAPALRTTGTSSLLHICL